MANAQGMKPSRPEIERQLDRLLADEVIASAPNSVNVLKYIVEHALDGQQVTEFDLLKGVFKRDVGKVDDSTARVAMGKLRTLLADYYKGDGQYDPIIVSLPVQPGRKTRAGTQKRTKAAKRIKFNPGEAYTPSFSYNPTSWMAKELALAHRLLIGGSPSQIQRAQKHLENIYRAEPGNPEGMLGTIEAWGVMLIQGVLGTPHITLVAGPLQWIDRIEKETGATWRTHGLRALLHFTLGETQKAKKEFDKALELNRPATISRGWYTHFLFYTGHEEQALRLLALQAEEHIDDAPTQAVYGTYLMRAHRHEEAEQAFEKSLALDRNCWIAHYGLTQMYRELGDKQKADEHAKRVEELVEPSEFEYLKPRLSLHPDQRRSR